MIMRCVIKYSILYIIHISCRLTKLTHKSEKYFFQNIYRLWKLFFKGEKPFSNLFFWQRNWNVKTTISISLIKIYFNILFSTQQNFLATAFSLIGIYIVSGKIKVFIQPIYTCQNNQSQRRSWIQNVFKSISRQYMSFSDILCFPLSSSFFVLFSDWQPTAKLFFWNKMNTIYFHPILFCINLLFLV